MDTHPQHHSGVEDAPLDQKARKIRQKKKKKAHTLLFAAWRRFWDESLLCPGHLPTLLFQGGQQGLLQMGSAVTCATPLSSSQPLFSLL